MFGIGMPELIVILWSSWLSFGAANFRNRGAIGKGIKISKKASKEPMKLMYTREQENRAEVTTDRSISERIILRGDARVRFYGKRSSPADPAGPGPSLSLWNPASAYIAARFRRIPLVSFFIFQDAFWSGHHKINFPFDRKLPQISAAFRCHNPVPLRPWPSVALTSHVVCRQPELGHMVPSVL